MLYITYVISYNTVIQLLDTYIGTRNKTEAIRNKN